MLRPLIALGLVAAASPAFAGSYSAKPLVPASGRIIAKNIVWNCGPDACVGATPESRPLVLCQGLAKKTGRLESFVADGRAFGAADLDRCNAFAKDGRNQAVAAAR